MEIGKVMKFAFQVRRKWKLDSCQAWTTHCDLKLPHMMRQPEMNFVEMEINFPNKFGEITCYSA